MTMYQSEDGTKLKRRWVEQAVSLAMQNRWEDAMTVNRRILEQFPDDVDAHNRLGRSLTELGRYAEARGAYSKAVEIDPHSTIAQKNLARLSTVNIEQSPSKAHEQIDPRLFIAETGKTGVSSLLRPAPRDVLARMSVGDKVYLQGEGRSLVLQNASGEYLGLVESRLSFRLMELMRGGNRYVAALMSLDETGARVIIREEYQDPSQSGRISFPAKGAEGPGVRPYTRDRLVRYGDDEDEEEEEGESEVEAEAEGEVEERAEEPETEEEDGIGF